MPRQTVLRIMILGFTAMVLLVIGAAYVGYEGSRAIRDHAQNMVRDHLVDPDRGAAIEALIERQSENLLDELSWILGACFVLAVAGSALTIWITNRAFRRLEWQSKELNRVSWHLVDTHEQVSRRFSHEMHDELGQALAGLKGMVKRMNGAEMEARRPEMIEVFDEVLRSVRELSQMLRPVILDDFGLDAGLRWLSERFTQRTQIAVDYRSNFKDRLAESIETHLFRISQEALTNVARHSGATQAWITLSVDADHIRLTVEDNGRGIQEKGQPAGASLGMVGMRARARQIGGELQVENRAEGGLRIELIAPFERPEDGARKEDSDRSG
jgi:signal transduction histidine kinase